MKRLLVLVVLLTAVIAGTAQADTPEWRSQQPLGPEGRTPLGKIGDLECWAADRCLLITGGNGGMPAGLYAYDGSGWYLYSTVCGGGEGRIAWAGPNDFWTVSDQQKGQETTQEPPHSISLCHFKDGAVVASYAEPVGVAGSYLSMRAAACLGPQECWFAGERLPGTVNAGAFHLYWNGLSLTTAPSLTAPQPEVEDPGRAVVSLAYHGADLFEGVRVQADDEAPAEPASDPSFFHRVLPGAPPEFESLDTAGPLNLAGAQPSELQGFALSDDGEALWAVSGGATALAPMTVLRLAGDGLQQLSLNDPGPVFAGGDQVTGFAAEPGAEAAWVGFRRLNETSQGAPARLALVHADGTVDPPVVLPVEGEGIGRHGWAGPIACPAPGQCWMATEREGWLFHLGPDPGSNGDPAMHTLITSRPADASLPSVPPTSLPEDDSGANTSKAAEEELEIQEEPLPKKEPALLSKLKQRLVGNTLELTFVLRAKARVQLLAKRKGHVVAKTKVLTMDKGPGRLKLHLDPERWPTKLDLKVHKVKKKGAKK